MSLHVNQEAEENLLGAMMLSASAIDSVIGHVEAADFYYASYGAIFDAMLGMHTRGEVVDLVTLAAELERSGRMDAAGGRAKLHEIAALVPATTQAPRYAGIVKEKATIRALQQAGMNITGLTEEPNGDTVDELIAKAEQHLSDAVLRNTVSTVGSITDGMEELFTEIKTAMTTQVPITGKLTGLKVLDDALSGFWPGQLIILGARPGCGKSALAQNITENMVDVGERVLFITLEMSKRELQIRGLARAAKLDSQLISKGLIPEDKYKEFGQAKATLIARADKFLVDDGGMATIPPLVAEATRLHRQGGLGLIVVDYLQLMQGVGKTKTEEIGYISRNLKLLARRLNVPVLALSQMNRNIIGRADKRPDLSDLRDSGSLEQDADVVMFLHRDSDYDTSKEADGTIEIIVAKNRRGSAESLKALFTGRYSSFLNAAVAS